MNIFSFNNNNDNIINTDDIKINKIKSCIIDDFIDNKIDYDNSNKDNDNEINNNENDSDDNRFDLVSSYNFYNDDDYDVQHTLLLEYINILFCLFNK